MFETSGLRQIAVCDAPASMNNWELFNSFVHHHTDSKLGACKQAYQLRLACEELFSNIIRHSSCSPENPSPHLWVRVFQHPLQPGCLVIDVEDNALPFDPQFDALDPVDTQRPINERSIGGLGLFLVKNSVSRVEYSYTNGRNIYRLFSLPANGL